MKLNFLEKTNTFIFLISCLFILIIFSGFQIYKFSKYEVIIDNSIYQNITINQFNNITDEYSLNTSINLTKEYKNQIKESNIKIGDYYKETYQDLIDTISFQITLFSLIFTLILVLSGFFLYNNVKEIKSELKDETKEMKDILKKEVENNNSVRNELTNELNNLNEKICSIVDDKTGIYDLKISTLENNLLEKLKKIEIKKKNTKSVEIKK